MQLLLLLLFSFLLSQDNYKSFKVGLFKGELVNSADNTSISYATIKLFKSSDNTLNDGTISGDDGYFILKDVNPGKYNIHIEHVMYETLILENQLLVPPTMNKNLGILALTQKVVEVADVSVVD